ncbi:hypothetical protein OHA25_44300 [Nonomuraea sp. NBC_00507]|uniref:hypothetical protein n=1 Tax=Nonomuraea sp. NBC_00507 TaxID=2976002 RepID=UPI002E17D91A
MGIEAGMKFGPVGKLADEVDGARTAVEEGRKALSDSPGAVTYVPVPSVPGSNAFGNTSKATEAGSAHASVQASADSLAEIFIGVLDSDGERLRKVIKAFKDLDDEIADQLFANAAKGFDVYQNVGQCSGVYAGVKAHVGVPARARVCPDLSGLSAASLTRVVSAARCTA